MANNATITWDTITRIQSDINSLLSQSTAKNMVYLDAKRQSIKNINDVKIVTMNFQVTIPKGSLSAPIQTNARENSISAYLLSTYATVYTSVLVPRDFYAKNVICTANLWNTLDNGIKGIQDAFSKPETPVGHVTISSKQDSDVTVNVELMFLLFPAQ